MKGLLFFAGSLIRWPAQRPKDFLTLAIYYFSIHGFTMVGNALSFDAIRFLFTIGIFVPIFVLIIQGLPLDCLDYKAAITRERNG